MRRGQYLGWKSIAQIALAISLAVDQAFLDTNAVLTAGFVITDEATGAVLNDDFTVLRLTGDDLAINALLNLEDDDPTNDDVFSAMVTINVTKTTGGLLDPEDAFINLDDQVFASNKLTLTPVIRAQKADGDPAFYLDNLVITAIGTPVPEPSTLALFVVASGCITRRRR